MSKAQVGDRVRIAEMKGESHYAGKEGIIEFIDDIGQLHGTWGGCAIIPDKDEFEVIERRQTVKCCFCGREISVKQAHNAVPLKEGYCCEQCNWKMVVPYRISLSTKEED